MRPRRRFRDADRGAPTSARGSGSGGRSRTTLLV
jgi:hypothetical protein